MSTPEGYLILCRKREHKLLEPAELNLLGKVQELQQISRQAPVITGALAEGEPAVAIERNPCEDVTEPGPGPDPGGDGPAPGGGSGTGSGTSNQPDSVDDAPALDPRPFPQPFRQQDPEQDQSEGPSTEEVPNKRVISTATREITVVPNSLFLSPGVDIASIKSSLSRNSTKKSQVNH